MNFDFNSSTPIYLQVAFQVEESILNGMFEEEGQVPSTTEISKMFKINPTTILKGFNLLVEDGILEKRRGIGMFVQQGAKDKVFEKRREQFLWSSVPEFLETAKKLRITEAELVQLIRGGFEHELNS